MVTSKQGASCSTAVLVNMDDIVRFVETAASKYKIAAERLLNSVAQEGTDERHEEWMNSVMTAAHEVNAAFDEIRMRVIPSLDALTNNIRDSEFSSTYRVLRTRIQRETPERMRVELARLKVEVAKSDRSKLGAVSAMEATSDFVMALMRIRNMNDIVDKIVSTVRYAVTWHSVHGPRSQVSQAHYHGDVVMGSKNIASVGEGSFVVGMAVGDGARADGSVNQHQEGGITQQEHAAMIKEAQIALVHCQDEIHSLLYDALNQFLRLVREIQVDQRSMAECQAKIMEAYDQTWAEQAAKGMRPQTISKASEIVAALVKHPLMNGVISKLIEGGSSAGG